MSAFNEDISTPQATLLDPQVLGTWDCSHGESQSVKLLESVRLCS